MVQCKEKGFQNFCRKKPLVETIDREGNAPCAIVSVTKEMVIELSIMLARCTS